MYGEGNSAKMVEDITKSMTQVQSGLNDSVGLDVKQLINTMVGIKTSSPIIENAVENGVTNALEK